ncbi:MAG: phosphotransferase [Rhodospirillales bacterium]|nr:phosphotransferase [Rhodospirillales bacterium]
MSANAVGEIGAGTGREAAIAAFLARAGWAGAARIPLAQDASLRRYWRIGPPDRRAVLMDAPPPEDVRPFLRAARHLAAAGLSVPAILAADADAGLVLEEDFGDAMLGSALDHGDPRAGDMLVAAAEALARLQAAPLPDWAAPGGTVAAWDGAAMLAATLDPLFGWWWPAVFGGPAPDAARHDIAAALAETLAPLTALPAVAVHRDYFAGNLVWLADRHGAARIGVLDFQALTTGSPAYDLVSLLQDSRRAIPADAAAAARAAFLAARPEVERQAFAAAEAAIAAQRHLRVSCQWVRLARRDGKPQYLAFGPHSWARLAEALTHPVAAPLRRALDRWVPTARRANPPAMGA